MMSREQAIFFEVMEDFNFEGAIEPLVFAYHDFIMETSLPNLSDIEVHKKAKECFLRYKDFWWADIDYYDMRWRILETLNLDEAEWEYADLKES
jgi:hypothetical protein